MQLIYHGCRKATIEIAGSIPWSKVVTEIMFQVCIQSKF